MKKPIEKDDEHSTCPASETKPIDGHEFPKDKETGEPFPNCCPFHKGVYTDTKKWFDTFPNCCDLHRAMASKRWFNKENYKGIEMKVVKQISYTEHYISEKIDIKEWYKDITDYIDYNIRSFGEPAIGLTLFLDNLRHYIQEAKSEISKDKRSRLIEFIDTYRKPVDKRNTDLNILYSTYNKWLNIFPFEISFFSNLKPFFEKQLPFLIGKPEYNPYTRLTKVKIHTKSSLIELLLNTTNTLITQINTKKLYEKGLLTKPKEIELELFLNGREQKLKQGYVNNSQNEETRYRKILKEWFKDEEDCIAGLIRLLESVPPQPIRTKLDVLKENLQKDGFYNLDKVKKLSETGQNELIELISENMAYGIAMFDYLGFCTFLDNEKGTKYKTNHYLSKLYSEKAKDGTQAKHYRNSLINNKPRYTSYLHEDTVIKDYENLK